jgi:DNA-binding CsgD family transcriptional regulator
VGDCFLQVATNECPIDRRSPDHWRFRNCDPLTACLLDPGAPPVLVQTLQAREIADSAYRWICYDRCHYSERMSICLLRETRWYVMNIYRRHARPDALVSAAASLCDFAELALPLLEQHKRLMPQRPAAGFADMESIKRRLEDRYPSLADRELEVCALTMSGFTAKSIARTLNISPATVMTYRRRAYAKLGISAAGALVPRMLS